MHSIQRQIIEITTDSQARAHEIGARLMAAWEAGVPAVERVFDRQAAAGVMRIDRLELDLGLLRGSDWLDTFFDRLAAAFESSVATGPLAEAGDGAASGAVIAAEGPVRSSRAGSDLEALIHFLRRGRLPWWSGLTTGPGWLGRQIDALPPAARAGLAKLAADEPVVLRRLVLHLGPVELQELFAAVTPPALRGGLAVLAEVFAEAVAGAAARWRLREAFWRAALTPAAPDAGSEAPALTGRAWAAALAAADPAAVRAVLARPASHARLPGPWAAALRQALEEAALRAGLAPDGDGGKAGIPQAAAAPVREPADRTAPEPRSRPGTRRGVPVPKDARPMPAGQRPEESPLDAEEIVSVTGAGAVLLHPFLPELFSRTGLWADGAFARPDAGHVAVRLLGYLTFGETEIDEVDLILAKTLCAMPWEEPLLPDPPEAEALEAADALLSAVLCHWTALRSSSADWLRAEFLLRDGHLRLRDEGWTLTVETRAQDVLLGKLPWWFGVVKLPWMPNPVTVRWRD